ncbi:MAG: RNA methyltransferase [Lachnospiraceae bacterium]|nr:RNA methyltransferase [Lachnospiraceae bacterium]
MLSSSSNPRIRNIAKLLTSAKERREQGLYVIEGVKLFLEAFEAVPERIKEVYLTEELAEKVFGEIDPSKRESENGEGALRSRLSLVRSALSGLRYETVSEAVFKKLSDTKTPQGIVCVMKGEELSFEKVKETLFFGEQGLLSGDRPVRALLLEGIQDPGNLGTMIRTAEAAGFDFILADQGTADYYNPKTIRSTMGSVFRMKVIYAADFTKAISDLRAQGLTVYAAHLKGENFYDEEDYAEKTAILIGNEGKGLSAAVSALADRLVKIPMQGKTESLNAGVAAALLMFESRQKHQA